MDEIKIPERDDGWKYLLVMALVVAAVGWGIRSWWLGRQEKSIAAAEFSAWRAKHCELERIDGDRRCYHCQDRSFAAEQLLAKYGSEKDRARVARLESRLGGRATIERGLTVCE